MATATDVLRIAAGELGVTERKTNRTKYGAWYGLDGNPWCAMFVSWVLHAAGYPLAIQTGKGFAWTPAGVAYAKRIGRWIGPDDLKPGDLIFFNFDNDAGPEHVGLVQVRRGPGDYTTIEGNTSAEGDPTGSQSNGGGVYQRHRHGGTILGGLRPSYAAQKPPVPKATSGDGFHHPMLGIGAGSSSPSTEVKHMQALLHRHGAIIVMDGVFGPATEGKLRAFQRAHKLTVDGVCGKLTWAQLHTAGR